MLSERQPHSPPRFAAFGTRDVDEFRHVALTRLGATAAEVSVSSNFEAGGLLIELEDIAVLSAASNSALAVEYPGFDFARLTIPKAGYGATIIGNRVTEINERQSCVTSPGIATTVRCDGSHEWLNLRVKSAALKQKLASILGARPNGDIDFAPASNLEHPRIRSLCQLTGLLAQQLNSASHELPPMVLKELEQAIIVAFLLGTRHSFSDLLETDSREAGAWQVRQIEEHIEAHWDQAINVETLAKIAGTSERAIFRAFQRSRGYSPMAFAKMVRLRRARELLAAPSDSASVTATAFRCGFSNLGHFAREYREAFGQLPSETLAQSRSPRGPRRIAG
jgi:AraC-like DNA-binding protein